MNHHLKRSVRRLAFPLLAGGLTALVLPWSSASAGEQPAFAGYNASGYAAPVEIEFYEPTIPIPATPQFELLLGYSRVEAETGIGRSRASWLWPGDPVGEGAKTFADQIGLPEQVGQAGYPVQVNSEHPTGEPEQRDEPFPGMIMRTSADAQEVRAAVGYSPDGEAQDPEDGGEGDDEGGIPGLPEPPAGGLLGGDSVEDSLAAFGAAITGDTTAAAEEPDAAEGQEPLVPPEVAAIVDFTAYTSQGRAVTGADEVLTSTRSSLGDVRLLNGLVTIESVSSRTTTTSDGSTTTATGRSAIGTLSIGGNRFSVGPDGIEAQGQQQEIPGLPDEPKAALAQLGLSFSVPEPELDRSGLTAESLVHGLVVEIDTTQLRSQLGGLPLADLIGQVPDELKDLRDPLQGLANLSPRIVVTLGNAATSTATVAPLEPVEPTTPTTGPTEGETEGDGGPGGSGTGGGVGSASGSAAPGAPADAAGGTSGELTGAQPMGNGLPPLNSIPGALTVGGIVAAAGAGSWLRKIGAVALGGAGTCPHGLDSGLPDLRKA